MNTLKKILLKSHLLRSFLAKRNNLIQIPKKARLKLNICGKNNRIIIAENVKISNGILNIFGNNTTIQIGKNTKFDTVTFWLEDDNSQIIIGNNCNFCGPVDISCIESCSIIIGDNLLASRNLSIVNGDSHSIIDCNGNRINNSSNITIGEHVWIGKNVNILKKGSIGSNSIVGANSLITKDFSNYSNVILAGSPAKIIKNNVNWDHKRL